MEVNFVNEKNMVATQLEQEKKAYQSPHLLEYGSIAELTLGILNSADDAGASTFQLG
jgi:hypothetical protein